MRFSDLDLYKDLLHEKAGLYVGTDKSWVLDARLTPIAHKWGYPSLTSMTHALRGIADPGLIKDVVEAMIDTQTAFFRDPAFFEAIRDTALPALRAAPREDNTVRIWHAGCSTGQEAYSMAMMIRDNADKIGNMKVEILATDISTECLNKAKSGCYTQWDVQQGLPVQTLLKYFTQTNEDWHIKQDIRSMVTFQYANLLDSMEPLGHFDIIFCCHVLDDIAHGKQPRIRENLKKQLRPGGYLVIEGVESLAS